MTFFSSLGTRRLASLALVFVIGAACAKVDRNYDDSSAGNGGTDSAGSGGANSAGSGGIAGAGTAGKAGSQAGGAAGSAGEAGAGGNAGESFAGAGGAANPDELILTVTRAGDGAGTVTSDLPGINCGVTCSAEYDPDTQVVLTAAPAANSTFTGWSGGGCSGTGTCTTVISQAIEVKATFTSIKVTLSVALAGTGVGVVKSVPAGIDCGPTCSLAVPVGAPVQLTATAATGSLFAGWSGGGCTGTGTCTTTPSAATSVTATFTLTTQTLTVAKSGTGAGTVTSAPAGINCGADCSEVVNYGTVVTLTAATSGTGSVFSGWSGGGCSGTGACVVTVTAATQVTAAFTCTGTVTVNYSNAITSFTVPTCVTSLTIDAYGAQGGSAGTFSGGLGARMKGTFAVTGGATLKVLVGGKGIDAFDAAQQAGGSGGGGTFVTNASNSPLVVAGGGGGAVNYASSPQYQGVGLNASITTAGTSDSGGIKAGGVNGNGGTTGSNSGGYHPGTGGGGLLTNGVGNSDGGVTYGTPYTPGFAFVNGGAGGQPGTCAPTSTVCIVGRAGGFGGGGAGAHMGGGGGGYSGGAGGSWPSGTNYNGGGGGGGSYNGGTAQTNTAGARLGNGMVIFTY